MQNKLVVQPPQMLLMLNYLNRARSANFFEDFLSFSNKFLLISAPAIFRGAAPSSAPGNNPERRSDRAPML